MLVVALIRCESSFNNYAVSGVGAMGLASGLSIAAHLGVFGPLAQAFSALIAMVVALIAAPLIAWATRGRYYLARTATLPAQACTNKGIVSSTVYRPRWRRMVLRSLPGTYSITMNNWPKSKPKS